MERATGRARWRAASEPRLRAPDGGAVRVPAVVKVKGLHDVVHRAHKGQRGREGARHLAPAGRERRATSTLGVSPRGALVAGVNSVRQGGRSAVKFQLWREADKWENNYRDHALGDALHIMVFGRRPPPASPEKRFDIRRESAWVIEISRLEVFGPANATKSDGKGKREKDRRGAHCSTGPQ